MKYAMLLLSMLIVQRCVASEPAGDPAEQGYLGMVLSPANPKPLPGIKAAAAPGLKVVEVIPGGPGEKAGIVPGDYVIRVNAKAVKSASDWKDASRMLAAGVEARIAIKRSVEDGEPTTVIIAVTPIGQRENRELLATHEARKIEAIAADEAEIRRRMMARPPVQIMRTWLAPDVIGQPRLQLEVVNNRDQAVEAYKVTVKCFTKFGEPVRGLDKDNIYTGISQNILPAKGRSLDRWQLTWHTTTGLAKVRVAEVKFADGTTWSPAADDQGWVEARIK